MEWPLNFISQSDFEKHIRDTIEKYGEKLESFDVVRFNKNIIDPIKMIFDKNVYRTSWEDLIGNEIFRQRDKSANNDIGYFHQRIFQYVKYCHVPDNGTEGGWDVIFSNPNGVDLPGGDHVKTIYVEMKNKHNTMNSSSAGKTYIKMQHQLLNDDDCACFLVEAIAKKSQNITWVTTVDGNTVSHKRIRRVSIDQFYEIVTGEKNAFYDMCMVLPSIVEKVVNDRKELNIPEDCVYENLVDRAKRIPVDNEELAMSIAVYLLGFSTYNGFEYLTNEDGKYDSQAIARISRYADEILKNMS